MCYPRRKKKQNTIEPCLSLAVSCEKLWDSLQNPKGTKSPLLFPTVLGSANSTSCLATGLSHHWAPWIFCVSQEKICLGGQVRKKYSNICGECTSVGKCGFCLFKVQSFAVWEARNAFHG